MGLVLLLTLSAPAAAQDTKQPRLDHYGDPLPEGAILRIGTVRLRPGAVVETLAFTPDAKQLVTVNKVTGAHVWDVKTGKLVRAFAQPTSAVALQAVSPDGSRVAVVGKDKVCTVWDAATGEVLRTFDSPWNDAAHLAFSPDGKVLAATDWRRGLHLWGLDSGKPLQKFEGDGFPSNYAAFAFAPDGKSLASTSAGGPFLLIDAASGKEIRRFAQANQYSRLRVLAFSPDGKSLAGRWDDWQGVDVWNVESGQKRFSIPVNRGGYLCVAFSADSSFLITGDGACDICWWDAATGRLNRQIAAHHGWIRGLAVSADGQLIASSSDDCTLRIWGAITGKERHAFEGHQAFGVQACFLADGKTIVSTSKGGYERWTSEGSSYRFWDATTGKELRRVGWDGNKVQAAVLSADGRSLALASKGHLEVRDVITGQAVLHLHEPDAAMHLHLPKPDPAMHLLDLTADGRMLAALYYEQDPVTHVIRGQWVKVWDVKAGKIVGSMNVPQPWSYACGFAGDGHTLVVHGMGEIPNSLLFWDMACRRQRCPAIPSMPNSLWKVSTSSRWIALADAGADKIDLRELTTGQRLARLATDGQAVTSVAFSPDGRLLAAGTAHGGIFLHDLLRGTVLARLRGHRSRVASVGFSNDGKRLVSGGDDTAILVWDTEPWRAALAKTETVLTAKELDGLWQDLASNQADRAFVAVAKLVAAPQAAAALLKDRLTPIRAEELAQVQRWVADLNNNKFSVREKATAELVKLGDLAVPALEAVLKGNPTLEVRRRAETVLQKLEKQPPSPGRLRQERALTVLEMLGTAEALAHLEALAQGEPEVWLTEEAKAACRRMKERG